MILYTILVIIRLTYYMKTYHFYNILLTHTCYRVKDRRLVYITAHIQELYISRCP